MNAHEQKVSLSDFIAGVREELEIAVKKYQAASQGSNSLGPMKVTEIVLETEVVTDRTESVDGKLSYWIASVTGKKETGNASTQKVTVRLKPPGLTYLQNIDHNLDNIA